MVKFWMLPYRLLGRYFCIFKNFLSFVLRYTKFLGDRWFPSKLVFRLHFIGPKQLSACYSFLPLLSQYPSVIYSFVFFFLRTTGTGNHLHFMWTPGIISFTPLEWFVSWSCTASSHSDAVQSLTKIFREASLSLTLSFCNLFFSSIVPYKFCMSGIFQTQIYLLNL